MNAIRLNIDGMHCGGCVRRVENVLRTVPGVSIEEVKVGAATLRLDPTMASAADITNALSAKGYPSREEGTDVGS